MEGSSRKAGILSHSVKNKLFWSFVYILIIVWGIVVINQDPVLDFANRVKGFPIKGASVPVILVVGERASADIESALDIADAFMQKPLNKPLFQKTFDAVASSV